MEPDASLMSVRLVDYVSPGSDGKRRLDWNVATAFLRSSAYMEGHRLTERNWLFSLEGFDYLNPDGLIWLLLLGDKLKLKDSSLWLQLPRDENQLRDLKSLNFHSIALENFSIVNIFDLDKVRIFKRPEGMQFFRINLVTLHPLLNRLSGLFSGSDFLGLLGISTTGELAHDVMAPFSRTIHETTRNIVQHSGEREDEGYGYFVVSQIGRSKIRLCVGDAGRGFLSSLLAKDIQVDNDFDAIKHALLFRYYRARGEGLFRVIQFVSTFGGVVRIRSGKEEGFLRLPRQLSWRDPDTRHFVESYLRQIPLPIPFEGVQIQIDVEPIQ